MTTIGDGELQFEAVSDWPQWPDGLTVQEAVGVVVDSRGRVIASCRGDQSILVFAPDGNFVNAWGGGSFERPHGIWIAEDDTLYLVDDIGHSVRQYTQEGELLRTIGPSGQPSDTGVEGFDHRSLHAAGPFNLPTNLVTASNGDIYITDGYGNARVHAFSAAGELQHSWGEPGTGDSEFKVPHGIGIDRDDRLYVADRENSRIQIFSTAGELLAVWTDVIRPCEVFVGQDDLVYVAELGGRSGMFPWMDVDPTAVGSRMSIFSRGGELLLRWGGGLNPTAADDFYALHDVSVDREGTIYTAEVVASASGRAADSAEGCPTLRKFVRRD
ncbi:MAG: hypothetical protein DWQ45_03830 [Planctomycetota bacterium]|nr:MAG: hypothetical protein DWQ45_03830 [Planctomycetota bacterium]